MAKKKKIPPPGRWFLSLDASQRDAEIRYLQSSLRLAREYFHGFEARDGYPLARRQLVRLPKSQLDRIRRVAKQVRSLTGSPYVTVTPRTAKQKKSAVKKTAQTMRGQKKFVVHTRADDKQKFRATFKDGNLEVREKYKGGQMFNRWYFLPRSPRTFDDLYEMVEAMLPTMPNGTYVLESGTQGSIGVGIRKNLILEELVRRWATYDKSLFRSLVALRLVGDTSFDASGEYFRRLTKREAFRQHKRELERAARKREKLTKRARLTGRR